MKLSRENLLKVGKGAVLAALGAGATYLLEAIPGFDFGVYSPLVAAGIAILANLIRKL